MQSKIVILFTVGMLLLSGFTAGGVTHEASEKYGVDRMVKTSVVNIPPLSLKDLSNGYVELHMNGVSSYLLKPGCPELPMVVKTFELPFGVDNVEVKLNPGGIDEYPVAEKVKPAPAMLPLNLETDGTVENRENKEVYESMEPFPSNWYTYRVGCGLNKEMKRVTFVNVHIYPVRYSPGLNELYVASKANLSISFDKPKTGFFPRNTEYDMVVIAPSVFSEALQPLVEHKNNHNIKTVLKTTEDIYDEYPGVDEPEKIKYFIKDAIEKWNITYVLLVGGLKKFIWANGRDDCNQGSKDWYLPVRYSNIFDNPKYPLDSESDLHDPGVISDLYYADVYGEGGVFESWDPNHDGVFLAWNKPGVENDTGIDFYPDVALGRLACRNVKEVKTVVNKIIDYESKTCDSSWFKRMLVVSGDGFLDQKDLNIQWDTRSLPDGFYRIYAQSFNPSHESGPMDIINITLDRSVKTSLSFNHNDYLRIHSYPGPPIAEIVSVSEGNVLGNTDFTYTPSESEAYCNDFNPWANISYVNGVLTIRGKSYDPKPYGNLTNIHVWVENGDGETVFSAWRNNTEMYYEGEWTTGEKTLFGRGGALYYMPEDFDREIVWTSNGKLTGQSDVINAFDKGYGFVFLSGHGSPNVWADHYPGVPGNRQHGSVTGLSVVNFKWFFPFFERPVFPIDSLSNGDKLPVAVVGGCHNSQFNVSAVPAFFDALHFLFKFIPQKTLWS
ncbi:MAG TPA: peptidase C25, partial [Thermoplasmatales archaeon]|nr:peptidase C25 [Thermoplasmatales archaeon]